ncbi:nif11-like leader peptide domain protein [Synechococcus sp. BIOS-E4-1]|uniref:Nif11-like leader peptide family natural product precursor n=1 Tax=Synechococcus sp. BIOS-E4-1 TaxID=1400864 RepID=UPI0016455F18|nr:Nif11-like leader peptide family natural product precursor [Synechococcus sp. BIOS-E4-1]QNI55236.1 nif11-like leader peptide domain protein [Synechococcus sp. BIOS-E4-1]
MTQDQLTAFLANAKGNTSLQEKLKAAADTNAVAAIAKEAGFSISADDLKSAQSEISDEELEGAAGGGFTHGFWCRLISGAKPKTTAPVRGGCMI